MITLIKQFWELINQYRKLYFLAGGALVIATAFQLAFPWLLRQAIDSLETHQNWVNSLGLFCIALLLTAAGQAYFSYLKGRWSSAATEGTIRDLRNRIFQHLMALPFSAHSKMKTGDVIQRSTSDVQTLGRFMGYQVTEVARTVCLLLGVSGLMMVLHRGLALYALSILVPIFLFSMYFFGKIQHQFELFDESEAAVSTKIQEHLTGIRVVKAFAREKYEQSRFNNVNVKLVDEDIKLVGLHAFFWPTSDMLCMLQVVIVLLAGGLKTIAGEISLGTFVAFNSYVMFLVWPVRHVGRLLGEMGRASVSLKRINEILSLPVEAPEPELTQPIRFRGSIGFDHVDFSINGTRILNDINFQVFPGQTVAILGATGSGKSMLVQLLTRFYENYDGQISIDGQEIRDIPRSALRSQIGLVMQEPFLFSRSIFENISFFSNNPEVERVKDAAVIASADPFIETLAEKYETVVGERGVTLSGGQKQRVALARTLFRQPSILILDDTTSALDTETEADIWAALKDRLSGQTALIITHRLSTAAGADRIIVLEKGKIVQQGSHKTLIKQAGYYRQLHELQTERLTRLNRELDHASEKTGRNRIPQAV